MPVLNVQTLASRVGKQIEFQRVLSTVIGSFGALAMVLACLGLYGVIAFNVKGRLPEIGIRMAFGARTVDVAGVFMRDAGRLVATGIILGAFLSLPAVLLITALLTDVRQYHATALVAVSAVLAGVAAASTIIPVLRATKMNPITVIRSD